MEPRNFAGLLTQGLWYAPLHGSRVIAEYPEIRVQRYRKDFSGDFTVVKSNSRQSGVPHSSDVAEGPIADDTIFNYVQSFLKNTTPFSFVRLYGILSAGKVMELYRFAECALYDQLFYQTEDIISLSIAPVLISLYGAASLNKSSLCYRGLLGVVPA